MRIAVLGATGGVGSLVVDRLLARGDEVTALVRPDPGVPGPRLPERAGLTVHTGELADLDVVRRTVAGADAVLSALGPSTDREGRGMPVAEGTAHVVEAMTAAGVRRYVGLATPSVADPRDRFTLQGWLAPRIVRVLLPRAVAEVRAMSEIVRSSGLDWTLVRVTLLTDGPPSGRARLGYLGRDAMGPRITRADVAEAMIVQIRDRTHLHASPVVGG